MKLKSKLKSQKSKPELKSQKVCLLRCGFALCLLTFAFALPRSAVFAQAQTDITIEKNPWRIPGNEPPIPVSISGFTGEAADVIHFDLFVQGFKNVAPDAAQFLLSGSGNGNLTGRASDKFNK